MAGIAFAILFLAMTQYVTREGRYVGNDLRLGRYLVLLTWLSSFLMTVIAVWRAQ